MPGPKPLFPFAIYRFLVQKQFASIRTLQITTGKVHRTFQVHIESHKLNWLVDKISKRPDFINYIWG